MYYAISLVLLTSDDMKFSPVNKQTEAIEWANENLHQL
jgi:hypothetical protein